jgi:hypothetical protein
LLARLPEGADQDRRRLRGENANVPWSITVRPFVSVRGHYGERRGAGNDH